MLTSEGDEKGHFTLTGRINGNAIETMVDSDSPETISDIDDIKEMMKLKTLFIRELPKDEEFVDFNKRKFNLRGTSSVT